MSMYLLAYHGGSLPEDDEEKASATSAWNAWYERLGEAVVDAGNPIARIATIFADGSASEHGTVDPVSGYMTSRRATWRRRSRWPGAARTSRAAAGSRSARRSRSCSSQRSIGQERVAPGAPRPTARARRPGGSSTVAAARCSPPAARRTGARSGGRR
jgi:hypothetical protein